LSIVRFFKPENRLAKVVAKPGGKYVTAAIAHANDQLLAMSEDCLKEVDEALARIYQSSGTVPTGPTLAELYRSVRDVAGLAAICNLTDLGEAALSFCALLDSAQDGGRLTAAHIGVYLNVFRMLRQPELLDEQSRRGLLQNLDRMVEKASA
jgi:hypothetical protein